MLASRASIEKFFIKNNISLVEERVLSDKDILDLYNGARELGQGFLCFIHFAIIHPDSNSLITNFDSWDEVYTFYTEFMIGFTGSKNN